MEPSAAQSIRLRRGALIVSVYVASIAMKNRTPVGLQLLAAGVLFKMYSEEGVSTPPLPSSED